MYTQEVKNKINGLGERKIINTFFVYLKIIYLHPPLLPTGSRFLPIDRYTRTAAFEVTNDLYFFRRAALRSIRSLSFGLSAVSFFPIFCNFSRREGPRRRSFWWRACWYGSGRTNQTSFYPILFFHCLIAVVVGIGSTADSNRFFVCSFLICSHYSSKLTVKSSQHF